MPVIRGSSSDVQPETSTAPGVIVRSFQIRNGLPCQPTRSWRKKIGPRLAIRLPIKTTGANTRHSADPTIASTMSIVRLSGA